jgi:hypothetical protein
LRALLQNFPGAKIAENANKYVGTGALACAGERMLAWLCGALARTDGPKLFCLMKTFSGTRH